MDAKIDEIMAILKRVTAKLDDLIEMAREYKKKESERINNIIAMHEKGGKDV